MWRSACLWPPRQASFINACLLNLQLSVWSSLLLFFWQGGVSLPSGWQVSGLPTELPRLWTNSHIALHLLKINRSILRVYFSKNQSESGSPKLELVECSIDRSLGRIFILKIQKPSKETFWLTRASGCLIWESLAGCDELSLGFDFLTLKHLQV